MNVRKLSTEMSYVEKLKNKGRKVVTHLFNAKTEKTPPFSPAASDFETKFDVLTPIEPAIQWEISKMISTEIASKFGEGIESPIFDEAEEKNKLLKIDCSSAFNQKQTARAKFKMQQKREEEEQRGKQCACYYGDEKTLFQCSDVLLQRWQGNNYKGAGQHFCPEHKLRNPNSIKYLYFLQEKKVVSNRKFVLSNKDLQIEQNPEASGFFPNENPGASGFFPNENPEADLSRRDWISGEDWYWDFKIRETVFFGNEPAPIINCFKFMDFIEICNHLHIDEDISHIIFSVSCGNLSYQITTTIFNDYGIIFDNKKRGKFEQSSQKNISEAVSKYIRDFSELVPFLEKNFSRDDQVMKNIQIMKQYLNLVHV
jgi:hypothetical protein